MYKACFSFAEEQAFLVIIGGGGNAPINFLILITYIIKQVMKLLPEQNTIRQFIKKQVK